MARSRKTWLALCALGAAGCAVSFGSIACGGADQSGVGAAKLPEGTHVETIEHEACDEGSGHRVETMDTNNDGKPDIKRVYDGKTNREICRITDLDHDGKPDMYEYYDASGTLRRREASFDGTGVVDSVEYFEGGKLAKRELDTTGQHRIDTWDYFDPSTGKRVRRERDSTNDGRVDQWWTYDGEKVTIAIDRNGDGKPDPADTVTIGGDQGPAPPTAPSAPSADAGPATAASTPPPPPPPSDITADAGPPPPAAPTDVSSATGDAGAPPKGAAAAKKKGGKK